MVQYTRHTTLFVSDQDRALDFYETLGLEKRDDVSGPFGRWLTVAPPGDQHEILLWPGTPQKPESTTEGFDPGLVFLEYDDLRTDIERMQSEGIEFDGEAPAEYEFGLRAETFDPDGNHIALRQDRNE